MVVGVFAGAAGWMGLLIGSFLNVVVWRLPRGESLSRPPSACPKCGHEIRWRDNIPVVSWLVLGGKCRDCSQAISARYPLVELGVAGFFAAVAWWVMSGGAISASASGLDAATMISLVAFLYLAAISVALTLIDLDVHKLPNKIVLPAYVVGATLLAAASLFVADYDSMLRAAIGCAAMFLAYLLMALAYPNGMGFGDVKLAGVLGLFLAWLGWGSLAVGAFAAFVLGGLFSIILLVLRRADRKSSIPFGPWMLAGAWVGIFWGDIISSEYLALFGLG
ncbi:prepilin peptidase [Homoserinimonas sp. A447]